MSPLQGSGSTRTAGSTIVPETCHVKGEYKRFARKVYSVLFVTWPAPPPRPCKKGLKRNQPSYNPCCFGMQIRNCDAYETRDTHFRQRSDTGNYGTYT